MVSLSTLIVRPIEVVSGGIVIAFEKNRELWAIPPVAASLLIIYDKLIKRDNKSIWESITLGWSPFEVIAGLAGAYLLMQSAPNPNTAKAVSVIKGGA